VGRVHDKGDSIVAGGYANPISAALGIYQEYRHRIREAVINAGVPECQVSRIMDDLQFAAGGQGTELDPQIWFSRRRPYRCSSHSWRDLAKELGLSPAVRDAHQHAPYIHQEKAMRSILAGRNTLIATGTGSGKTEAFFLPVMERCLRDDSEGLKSIILYPRNALAEDQVGRLKQLAGSALTVEQFVGVDNKDRVERNRRLLSAPPDILVTNVWMLERILTNSEYAALRGEATLATVVLDELHMLRGQMGADVAWLLRRLKSRCRRELLMIGASATLEARRAEGQPEDAHPEIPLEEYLELLFACRRDTIEVIRPEYEPEYVPQQTTFPVPAWDMLDWVTGLNNAQSISAHIFGVDPRNFKILGDERSPIERKAKPTALRDNLREHVVVDAWKQLLDAKHAVTFGELAQCVDDCARQHGMRCTPEQAAAFTRAMISLLDVQNYLAIAEGDAPDFTLVIQMVLRSSRGTVCMDLRTGTYSLSDASPHSPSIFDVWARDADWILAGVTRDRELVPLSNVDPKDLALVVRIARRDRVGDVEGAARFNLLFFHRGDSFALLGRWAIRDARSNRTGSRYCGASHRIVRTPFEC
jgi:DEAD/DEAH box helicase